MKVSEGLARPARGLGQGGAGYLLVDLLDEFTAWEPTTRQYGLAVVALSGVVSFVQNQGENRGWWRPVLRSVPPLEVEVVDEKVDAEDPKPVADADDPDDPDIKPPGIPAAEFPDADEADLKGGI